MSDFGLQVWDADITVEFILKSSARFHINYKKCILGMYLVGFELRFFLQLYWYVASCTKLTQISRTLISPVLQSDIFRGLKIAYLSTLSSSLHIRCPERDADISISYVQHSSVLYTILRTTYVPHSFNIICLLYALL